MFFTIDLTGMGIVEEITFWANLEVSRNVPSKEGTEVPYGIKRGRKRKKMGWGPELNK